MTGLLLDNITDWPRGGHLWIVLLPWDELQRLSLSLSSPLLGEWRIVTGMSAEGRHFHHGPFSDCPFILDFPFSPSSLPRKKGNTYSLSHLSPSFSPLCPYCSLVKTTFSQNQMCFPPPRFIPAHLPSLFLKDEYILFLHHNKCIQVMTLDNF